MFGQQNTTPFGSPPATSTPFGQPQQQQQSAFGSPAPAFGGGATAFGQQAQQPTGFGQPQQQQQSTGFGGFGAATPAPAAPTGFGGGGGFGSTAPSTTSPFGAPSPSPGLFGSSAPSTSTGGLFSGGATTNTSFGAPTTQQSTTFGGGGGLGISTSTTFGAPAAPSAFGAPASGGSIFGAPAPAPSAFGGSPPTLFGASPAAAPTGGSIFGAPAAPAGGMFGATAAQGVNGTASIPFQKTQKTDGTSSITFESITAMPQYESTGKSFEELRFEDYSQGNRGSGSNTPGGFGATSTFANAPAAGGFASTFGATAPAPAPTGGLFGQPTPAPAPAFGGFGAPAPAPTGGLFGSTSAPPPSTGFGGFGAPQPAPAPGGLFGSPAPAPSTGLFGQPAAAPAAGGGLFGSAPAPAVGGSLFGSTPAPPPSTGFGGFGAPQPAPAPGGLFGSPSPAPAGGLFGSTAAPSTGFGGFGAPQPAPTPGGLFSQPAPAPGGLFGSTPAPAPSSGFGFAPQPSPAAGSLFGSPPSTQGGLFGAPSAAQAPVAQQFGAQGAMIVPPATDALLQQQLAAIENQRKELEQMDVWRGGSPQTSTVIPSSNPESQGLRVSPYSPPMSSAVPYRASPRSTAKIRPRGFDSPQLPSSQKTPLPFMSPDGFVASTTKRLVIKSTTPKPSMRLRLRDVAVEETKEEVSDDVILRLPAVSPPAQTNFASPPAAATTPVTSPPVKATPQGSAKAAKSTTPTNGSGLDFYNKVVASAGTPGSKKKAPQETETSFMPKLTLEGYTVSPSLEEMASMSEAELATVSEFIVTRGGVGSVSWDGSVDVRGIDLDRVIAIEPRDVAVYDEQEKDGTKPKVGDKLNRPAVISMYGVYPKEGSDAAAIEKFERKIAKTTKAANAELISYDSNSGVWKFRVPHFSRYALLDDSDDEDEEDMEVDADQGKPASQNFETGERGGRSPQGMDTGVTGDGDVDVAASWFGAFHNDEDEEMVDVALVDSKENDESEKNVIRDAEKAYKMMSATVAAERAQKSKQKSILKKQTKETKRQEDDSALFCDEGVTVDDTVASDPAFHRPTQDELATRSRPGICSRIAQRTGIQSFSASSTDYGMRMGRSFRVGWNPDGSFLHLQPGNAVVIQQSRPVFTDGTVTEEECSKLLETHLINANKISSTSRECPSFCLAPADDGKLRKTLTEYVSASVSQARNDSDPEESLFLMRAFSLLLALFAEDSSGGSTDMVGVPMIEAADEGKAREVLTEKGRIDVCIKWLTEACAEDVRNEIRETLEKNDVHSAIFAAATGGDIEQASAIAMNHGYLHLASLLATGTAGFDLVRDQVQQWNESGAATKIPAELLRIYSILGGGLSAEQQIHLSFHQTGTQAPLDWRRRLCMLLTFGVHSYDEATLPSLMETYANQVAENTSPYPSPRYIWNEHVLNEDGPESLLYKILELVKCVRENEAETESLATVVSPSGYTGAISDFSGSFHVAAVISALGVSASLSPLEQARLLDSYASQLVSNGQWDLAVYVMLCSFGNDRPEDLVSRERVAKAIVLQNCPDVPEGDMISRRAKLEHIGVPSAWFEEALAYRCGNKGDSFDFISHLSKFSPEQARTALEELVVPNMLLMSAADARQSLDLLAAFAWDEDSLAATVVDFFQLAEDIVALSKKSNKDEEENEDIASLTELAGSVKTRLRAYRSYCGEIQNASSCLHVVPGYRLVPTSAFLAEALAGVTFLQLQLGALAAGSSIWDDAYLQGTSKRPLKVASELALIAARNANSSTSSDTNVGSPSVTLAGLM